MLGTPLIDQSWLEQLSTSQPRVAGILSKPPQQQQAAGYFHTLREILQQPSTWSKTARQMTAAGAVLQDCSENIRTLVLTGSGSSQFAGECVLPALRQEMKVAADVVGGGTLLTYGEDALGPERPALVISLSRSGDSPETVGAVSRLLDSSSEIRHLVLTCNREGRVADAYGADARVRLIALDDDTNDRSLVMTSSFTNLVLAARALAVGTQVERYRSLCTRLSSIAAELLRNRLGAIAGVASSGFRRAVYLGSGPLLGAARESALKMLEMTAGSVATLSDSYLGFRHGPMSFTHHDTLIVCFLSSRPLLRAYEGDLLQELDDKQLGLSKLIVGDGIPKNLAREGDLIIECPGLGEIGDDDAPVIHVIAGQLLAFFRCLEEGLRPDSPSESGVINRVVQSFKLHLPGDYGAGGRDKEGK